MAGSASLATSTAAIRRIDPPALLGIVASVIWLIWAALDGGFFASGWGLLGAVLVVALALTVGFEPPALDRARTAMLVVLAAFVAWNFLSLLWAAFPGEAWIGADKSLLYAAGFAAFALWPASGGRLLSSLVLFAAGVGLIGASSLAQAVTAEDPGGLLVDGRLGGPIEYVNGSVGLWMMAFWPALLLSTSRRLAPWWRALFQGVSVVLLALTLLGQSRGWLFLLPVAAIAFVLLSRQRLRSLLALALSALSLPVILPSILDVSTRAEEGRAVGPALDEAALAIALAATIVGAAAGLIAIADRRIRLSRQAHRVTAVVVAIAVAAGVATGVTALSVRVGEPDAWLADKWHEFTSGQYPEGPDRLTSSLGTNRYAEWRVALTEFRDHPVVGIGADNYAAAYLEHRRTDAYHPRYPHSTPLRLLSQLGLVGTVLFAGVVGIAGWLGLRRRRTVHAAEGSAVGAALMIFVYWLLHGSIDWFWEIPALAAPAFGFLALASAPLPGPRESRAQPRRRARFGALLAAVTGAAAIALLAPWLAAAYQESAVAVWRSEPAAAYARLDRAAEINRLSGEPLVVAGVIAVRRKEYARAARLFERARTREPDNWYVHRQLGLLCVRAGEDERGLRLLERARRLNPREPSTLKALAIVRAGRPVTAAVLRLEAEPAES
jgi:hypothetical protein